MTHDYFQLFSLFQKGIMGIIGNNEQKSRVGARAPTRDFCLLIRDGRCWYLPIWLSAIVHFQPSLTLQNSFGTPAQRQGRDWNGRLEPTAASGHRCDAEGFWKRRLAVELWKRLSRPKRAAERPEMRPRRPAKRHPICRMKRHPICRMGMGSENRVSTVDRADRWLPFPTAGR